MSTTADQNLNPHVALVLAILMAASCFSPNDLVGYFYMDTHSFTHPLEHVERRLNEIEQRMATKDALKGFATRNDLKQFSTKDDLKGLASKKDLIAMETRLIRKLNRVVDFFGQRNYRNEETP